MEKFLLNKKGTISGMEMVLWLVRMIIIIGVVFSVIFFVRYTIAYSPEVNDLESELLIMRIINSKDCFAYEDVRVYPGILDIKKINEDNLKKCLKSENYFVKVSIDGKDYYNADKDSFEKEKRRCILPGYYCNDKKEKKYVLVRDNDNLKGEFIEFDYVLKDA